MHETGQFNVVTAGALVLGGLAALVLAVVVATKEPRPPAARAAPSAPPSAAPASAVEYDLDTADADDAGR